MEHHETISERDDQNNRYWLFIFIFIILVGLSMYVLKLYRGSIPQTIPLFDAVLLILAGFRLIRLFTYDQIMRAVRDLFVELKETTNEQGEIMVVRRKARAGGKRSLGDLFSCPWCMGIWVSYFTVFLYFMFPIMKYPVMILAFAGVASCLQIVMNKVGAEAELYKRENNILN